MDAAGGSDSNPGSLTKPFRTLQAAVNAAAAAAASLEPSASIAATINLRGGTHYLAATVQIAASQLSSLVVQNYNGEVVVVSGATPLPNVKWEPFNVTPGISNMYSADLASYSALAGEGVPGFQVGGLRVTRARFPNGNPEYTEKQQPGGNPDGPVLMPGASSYWMPPDATLLSKIVQVVNHNASQARPGGVCCSAPVQPVYTTYMGGIGGPCQIYSPPFSYWCSATVVGGGAHIAQHNTGVRPPASALAPSGCSDCADAGLHMPYSTMEGAIINAMHDSRWANWMWEVSKYNTTDNSITFGKGGFQESRGTDNGGGGDWFVENVYEEWDSYVFFVLTFCVTPAIENLMAMAVDLVVVA